MYIGFFISAYQIDAIDFLNVLSHDEVKSDIIQALKCFALIVY